MVAKINMTKIHLKTLYMWTVAYLSVYEGCDSLLPQCFLRLKAGIAENLSQYDPGPVFTKGLNQGLGLKLRLLSQVSAQKLLRLLS